MKIAIASAPWIAVPPVGYGGLELVVNNLTEELVKRGHQVMLFATGDSKTSARLEYYFDKAVGNNFFLKQNPYTLLYHSHKFNTLLAKEDFDIIHNHGPQQSLFFLDLIKNIPFIHTLHGSYYQTEKTATGLVEEKRQVMFRFKNHPYVSISNQQRTALPELNYIKTVYNGVRADEFTLGSGKGGYLAWLGRITPSKGVDTAIKLAKKVGLPLKIAAFIDEGDREYFKKEIAPLLDNNTELIDELKTSAQKNQFLGQAVATLFPIRWNEPFGLVMVESMAAGTPVIALNKGSVPEVIEEGKTGFSVETEENLMEAIKKVGQIDRQYCRNYAISKFSVEKMTDGYLEAYDIAIKQFRSI